MHYDYDCDYDNDKKQDTKSVLKCHPTTLPRQRQEQMHLDLSIAEAFDGKSVWYLIYLHEG